MGRDQFNMEKREKIFLVTGSTGFLGSAITRKLLASGYKLRLLVRKRNYDALPISFGWEGTIKERILGNQLDEYLPEQGSMAGGRPGADELLYDLFSSNVEIFIRPATLHDIWPVT